MTRRAFTLVELLLAMSLTILVGGVMYLLQTQGLSTVAKGTTRLTLQSELRRKMERLVTDLRAAKEILEIRPDYLKISRFPDRTLDDEEIPTPVVVTYQVERSEKRAVLIRTERGEPPVEILSADHIGEEIFRPFFMDQTPDGGPQFTPFDMHVNDSGQRRRITFLRIQLRLRQGRESITLTTAVTLRTAHSRLLQPAWHFR
ncbi:MAG: hypothetical protein OZSIB_0848 [Candidatus Ozemobacter sibiricus]|jgi:hypothetical protein|uniref:Prepilin-type N-terminal cleavage/methylation domain-containing protein n=1 Tax=Candidatus Ozemobacter sibiricus TaxID=2268124 RepID=A0A367ZU85_9BACT|nr:MAG: hypothetical protein OZSIB_0848 [Candidatus Ozemobacter sibiricus]